MTETNQRAGRTDSGRRRPPDQAPRRVSLLALAVAATVAVAACGGGSTGRGSAGATSPSGGQSTTTVAPSGNSGSASAGHANQTEQLRFAQCMRSHGIPNYPDPGNGGQLQALANSGINTQSPTYQAALGSCRQYTPAGNLTPAQSAAQAAQGLRFAQCMRSHGVPNYPDPTRGPNGEPAINLGAAGIDRNSPLVQAANATCQKLVPGGK